MPLLVLLSQGPSPPLALSLAVFSEASSAGWSGTMLVKLLVIGSMIRV